MSGWAAAPGGRGGASPLVHWLAYLSAAGAVEGSAPYNVLAYK
jgi:hypothetical protein